VVRLDALPLTAAGKTDLRALRERLSGPADAAAPAPEPAASAPEPAASVAATVAAVWAEVLRVPAPAPQDGFLDSGGHSLAAMRLVAALRDRLGRDVAVADVHAGRTLGGLIRRVEAAPPLDDVDLAVAGAVPTLSPAQRRMWFVEQVAPGTPTHNITFAERLRGPLDLAALRTALATVVRRHAALRWRVPRRDGVPTVAVVDATASLLALDDHRDAEHRTVAHAAADHVEIARLEDSQLERAARKQHGVQRKQRNGVHGLQSRS